MVEMRYDNEKNNLKLPKNIRQVGKPSDKIKIYVEDYVITYINQIARDSSDKQRLAVLLGRLGKNGDTSMAFIDGAVEAKDVVVQEDQVVFTSEIWTQIYDEIGQYFHNTEVVGWFLTRPGKSLGINEKITKIHVDNFPGVDKALFIIDPLDHDEAFYIYNQGDLVRQEGYYIYYERNEDMQNYMVDHRNGESSEQNVTNPFLRKREEAAEEKNVAKGKDSGLKSLFFKSAEEKSAQAENTLGKSKSKSGIQNDADGGGELLSAVTDGSAKSKSVSTGSKGKTAESKHSLFGKKVAAFDNAGDVTDETGKVIFGSGGKNNSAEKNDGTAKKAGGSGTEILQGLKRASSLVITFGILFALIFGFTQLNQKQEGSQQVSSNSGSGVVPVDEVAGNVKTESEKMAAANTNTTGADNNKSTDASGTNVADGGAADASGTNVADGGTSDASGTNVADKGTDGASGTNAADKGADGASGTNVADKGADGASGTNVADGNASGASGTGVAGNTDGGTKTADGKDDGNGTSTADNGGNGTSTADGGNSEGVAVGNVIRQYEVKEGDTLAGISQQFYKDYKYIELIQEMNQIEDPNMIFPGMKLNLP